MPISLFTANLQTSNPHLQPPTEELARMTARAGTTHPSSPLPSSPPHPHPHSLDAVIMGSVKGVGSSLGMAIMDEDMPGLALKRPWADVESMLPLQGQGQAAPQSSGAAAGDKAIIRTKIARWLKRIWRLLGRSGRSRLWVLLH
jgi:hypothetical protein